jgi:hypothetical protein
VLSHHVKDANNSNLSSASLELGLTAPDIVKRIEAATMRINQVNQEIEELLPLADTLNARLLELRKMVGFTQDIAARAAGVSVRQWKRCEQGEYRLDLRPLGRFMTQVFIQLRGSA